MRCFYLQNLVLREKPPSTEAIVALPRWFWLSSPSLPVPRAQAAVSSTRPQEPLTMVAMCYRDGSQPLGTKGFPSEPANSAAHHFLVHY